MIKYNQMKILKKTALMIYSRQYTAPMGGTIGKNVKWNDSVWKKEKKKNEEVVDKIYSSDIYEGEGKRHVTEIKSVKFKNRLKEIQASQPTEEYLFPGWKNFENMRYIPPKSKKEK